jgi:Ca2+:H+ antiporter
VAQSEAAGAGVIPRTVYLAVLAPLAFVLYHFGLLTAALCLAVLALVGGAFLLGEAAEVVAQRLGEALGALLTASLSNVVTLALLGAALIDNERDFVRASIVGAILGNLLLALGGGMLLGGWGRERQRFGREAAATNTTLLLVSGFAILFPTLADAATDSTTLTAAHMTTPLAVVLFLTYVAGLVFSVRTHKHLFDVAQAALPHSAHPWIRRFAPLVLILSVALVGWMADIVAGTIGPAGARLGLSPLFMGVVVVGAISNSVEISAAWRFARQDRMNLTLQIATGSCIQVMLFVVPVLVLFSLALPAGLLALQFNMPMAIAVLMSVILVNVVAADGESTWYEGVMLVALFVVVAVAFYVLR